MNLTHDQAAELLDRYGRAQRVIQRAVPFGLPHDKLAKLRKKYSRCPRCGKSSASIIRVTGMSNSADVSICEWCRFEESLEQVFRPLPLEHWAICKDPERWGMRMEGGDGVGEDERDPEAGEKAASDRAGQAGEI